MGCMSGHYFACGLTPYVYCKKHKFVRTWTGITNPFIIKNLWLLIYDYINSISKFINTLTYQNVQIEFLPTLFVNSSQSSICGSCQLKRFTAWPAKFGRDHRTNLSSVATLPWPAMNNCIIFDRELSNVSNANEDTSVCKFPCGYFHTITCANIHISSSS